MKDRFAPFRFLKWSRDDRSEASAALGMDVLILGMHRSGTSALAGTLHCLGLRVPEPHIPTTCDNASGFFENKLVRDYNEHALEVAGSSWHDPWPVSTARAGFSTPRGVFHPQSLQPMHY